MRSFCGPKDRAKDSARAGKCRARIARLSPEKITRGACLNQTGNRHSWGEPIDTLRLSPFHERVKPCVRAIALSLSLIANAFAVDHATVLPKVNALPTALSNDFEFRKTKIYMLTDQPVKIEKVKGRTVTKVTRNAAGQDPSITFERQYRLFGATTALDRRQRTGEYFDFFWHAKRHANITVRLEYRQEKLRAFLQARELSYPRVHGSQKTEFAIIGDDYLDQGRVIAWRCVLIENGRTVAQNRSYLWE